MAEKRNRDFVRIFGDLETGVWIGPKTLVEDDLPQDLADPTGFVPVGWLSSDGVMRGIEKDRTDHTALQDGSIVRVKVTKVTQTITFIALETSPLVLSLVNGGQPLTLTAGGLARQDINKGMSTTLERAVIIDAVDGDIWERTVIGSADITMQGEVALAHNEDIRAYEFTATILAGSPAYQINNDPLLIASIDELPVIP